MKKELLIALIVSLVVVIVLLYRRSRSCPIQPIHVVPPTPPVIPAPDLPCLTSGNLSSLSHSATSSPYTISGFGWAFYNWKLNTYTLNDDTVRTNGGYLFLHNAPSDTTPHPSGPSFASGTNPFNPGLQIVDHAEFVSNSNTFAEWLPFDGATFQVPQDCLTSPDPSGGSDTGGTTSGWINQTFGVTEWVDASNVTIIDNGTDVDISWNSIPGVEEYAIELRYTGTAGIYPCFAGCTSVSDIKINYGKIVSGDVTSTNLIVSQTAVPYVGFWQSVQNLQARVVGYALCNKSAPLEGCAGVYFS